VVAPYRSRSICRTSGFRKIRSSLESPYHIVVRVGEGNERHYILQSNAGASAMDWKEDWRNPFPTSTTLASVALRGTAVAVYRWNPAIQCVSQMRQNQQDKLVQYFNQYSFYRLKEIKVSVHCRERSYHSWYQSSVIPNLFGSPTVAEHSRMLTSPKIWINSDPLFWVQGRSGNPGQDPLGIDVSRTGVYADETGNVTVEDFKNHPSTRACNPFGRSKRYCYQPQCIYPELSWQACASGFQDVLTLQGVLCAYGDNTYADATVTCNPVETRYNGQTAGQSTLADVPYRSKMMPWIAIPINVTSSTFDALTGLNPFHPRYVGGAITMMCEPLVIQSGVGTGTAYTSNAYFPDVNISLDVVVEFYRPRTEVNSSEYLNVGQETTVLPYRTNIHAT